jgi:hypothetical protein
MPPYYRDTHEIRRPRYFVMACQDLMRDADATLISLPDLLMLIFYATSRATPAPRVTAILIIDGLIRRRRVTPYLRRRPPRLRYSYLVERRVAVPFPAGAGSTRRRFCRRAR